jgi:hypothetical protein
MIYRTGTATPTYDIPDRYEHTNVVSSAEVPHDNPTLLFTECSLNVP